MDERSAYFVECVELFLKLDAFLADDYDRRPDVVIDALRELLADYLEEPRP
jgi:hypothetical protein